MCILYSNSMFVESHILWIVFLSTDDDSHQGSTAAEPTGLSSSHVIKLLVEHFKACNYGFPTSRERHS